MSLWSLRIHTDVGKAAKVDPVGCGVGTKGRLSRFPLSEALVLKALVRRPYPVGQINSMHSPWLTDYYPSSKIINFTDI